MRRLIMYVLLFVQGGRPHSDVQILAVSHSGIRLVKREAGQAESLHVLQSLR